MDGITKATTKVTDLTALQNIVKYEKISKGYCKIGFHIYTEKESKHLKWRDLTGTKKLKTIYTN